MGFQSMVLFWIEAKLGILSNVQFLWRSRIFPVDFFKISRFLRTQAYPFSVISLRSVGKEVYSMGLGRN